MSTFADEVAALRGTRPATFKDLITQPAFSKLLIAQTVSSLGDWVGFVAVTALVVSKGGNAGAYAVAGVMVARMLPAILFGPFAGAFVDRFDRKKIMIAADIARGALYATMAFVHRLGVIFLLSFVIECFSLLWTPARDGRHCLARALLWTGMGERLHTAPGERGGRVSRQDVRVAHGPVTPRTLRVPHADRDGPGRRNPNILRRKRPMTRLQRS